ncbi:MAG: trypsin-like serine protease, partial [Nitrososphaerales archaeon]
MAASIAFLGIFAPPSSLAVYRGQVVTVRAAPWTVVVLEPEEQDCTGVILDPLHVLTAGHCVTVTENSDSLMSPTALKIEAGVSNYKHLVPSDVPQTRTVTAVRLMPGYAAAQSHAYTAIARDLAVLTLSHPLDLNGPDARAAGLPVPHTGQSSRDTKVVMAGFGEETPDQTASGALNEIAKPTISAACSGHGILCVEAPISAACYGDSGSGLVEPGSRPTLVGIASEGLCQGGVTVFAPVDSPAALRFIESSLKSPHGAT